MEKSQNNPYYLIDNISYGKKEIDQNTVLVNYSPFLSNRSFSYHIDSLIYANEMNKRHFMDKDMQYQFLLNTLRARKRLARWSKKDNADKLKIISEHYNYSPVKAFQVVDLFDDETIDAIKNNKQLSRGGIEK